MKLYFENLLSPENKRYNQCAVNGINNIDQIAANLHELCVGIVLLENVTMLIINKVENKINEYVGTVLFCL